MRTTRGGRLADATIDGLRPDGDGEARIGRTLVTVPFALPGERVRIAVTEAHGTGARGELLEIIRASPARVEPPCRHFGPPEHDACGGCAWQHLAYDAQLTAKRARVQDAATRALRQPPVVEAVIPADPPWHYRHKVHFAAAADRRQEIHLGHYARHSRRLIPVEECPAHAVAGNAAAFQFARALSRSRAGAPLRSWLSRVSRTDGSVAVTLVTSGVAPRPFRAATERILSGMPSVVSVAVSEHDGRSSQILGARTRLVRGDARVRETVAGVTFLISPAAFFQTNVAAAEHLVHEVLRAIPATASVLDLYCGGGLFSLPLALRGQRVTGIESNAAAVADAVASRQANRIRAADCRFIVASAEAGLRGIDPAAATAVVLDPPRAGASPAVLNHITRRIRPEVMAYVSCDVEALERDLAQIEQNGYAVTLLQPIDMFPHTPEVETVAVAHRV